MRNLKRALSLALAAVMLIGMMALGTSAASVSDFSDGNNIEHEEAASIIAGLNIVSGYEDGSFRPDSIVTRAEMAVFISKMLHGSTIDPAMFADEKIFTDYDGWSNGWVNLAYTDGIISGYGDGRFGPGDTLTVLDATTMILKALGVEYDPANRAISVMTKASELGLFGDMVLIGSKDMTRDQVAALSFETLLYSPSGERTYTVTVGGSVYTFDSAIDAYFYADANGGTLDLSTAKDSLGAKIFGLTVTTNSTDEFGRTVTAYTSTKEQYKDLNVVIAGSAATYTYTSKTASDKLGLASGITFEVENDYYLDGVKGSALATTAAEDSNTVAKVLANLTADNAVVEVYVSNNKVTKVVKVVTYTSTVGKPVKASGTEDRYIPLTNSTNVNRFYTENFAEGDVVLYTKAWDGEDTTPKNYDVVDIKLADSFTGTLTRFTSDHKFTINGSVYTLPTNGAGVLDLTTTTVEGFLGDEMVYYLNNNGQIICATTPDGSVAPSGNYAYILKSNVTVSGNWLTLGTITAEVQAVLSDGSVGVFELPVKKTAGTSENGHAGYTKYTVKIGDVDTKISENEWIDDSTSASALQGLLNNESNGLCSVVNGNVYPYSINSKNEITLGATPDTYDNTQDPDDVVLVTLGGSISAGTVTANTNVASHPVILNNNTVFVLIDGDKASVVTGSANLGSTPAITSGNYKGIVATIVGETKVAVADVVFAAVKYTAGGDVDTSDYIYVSGEKYTEYRDGKEVEVYYAYKADGTVLELAEGSHYDGVGIYTYDSVKMELASKATASTTLVHSATVTYVSGETVVISSSGITVNDSTNIVLVDEEEKLEAGAKIAYVTNDKGVASVVFVLTPDVVVGPPPQAGSAKVTAVELTATTIDTSANTPGNVNPAITWTTANNKDGNEAAQEDTINVTLKSGGYSIINSNTISVVLTVATTATVVTVPGDGAGDAISVNGTTGKTDAIVLTFDGTNWKTSWETNKVKVTNGENDVTYTINVTGVTTKTTEITANSTSSGVTIGDPNGDATVDDAVSSGTGSISITTDGTPANEDDEIAVVVTATTGTLEGAASNGTLTVTLTYVAGSTNNWVPDTEVKVTAAAGNVVTYTIEVDSTAVEDVPEET